MMIVHRKITWLLLFSTAAVFIASWLIYLGKENLENGHLKINDTYETLGLLKNISYSLGQDTAPAGLRAQIDSLSLLSHKTGDQHGQIILLQHYLARPLSADSRAAVRRLLTDMTTTEQGYLRDRIRQNTNLNNKTARSLMLARVGGFLFVAILLLQLNRDISRRKKIQEHLETAIREAHQARHMQEQFLANMSHEIRTPMNGIKGMTDLLLDTPLSAKQAELASTIKSSAGNLLVIINDILDFSKIQAGKLNIESIDFSIHEVLHNTSSAFEHRIKKKGLELRIDIDPTVPGRLIGDPYRLSQVLVNIVGNAIKFTEEGHIIVRVSATERSDQQTTLHFSISDSGVGISPAHLPSIFDSFSQAGEGKQHRYGGTGLGLTICRQLLHLQGGDISVSSTQGQGSTFTFYITYGNSNRPATAPLAAAPQVDHSRLLEGRRFLVAEDNEINQKLIDYVLTRAGGAVQLAGNGAQAIDLLRKDNEYDLIIMDLQMPEMDGYAATRYIRNDLHLQTPIIAMTATAMKGEQLQCLRAGMNKYMTKPFEFLDLYKRIGALLSLNF